MPFVRKSFLVPVCPVCGSRVGVTGEGGYSVFDTVKEARDALSECGDDLDKTLDERIASSCENKDCRTTYGHRHCKRRPCGYCKHSPVESTLLRK